MAAPRGRLPLHVALHALQALSLEHFLSSRLATVHSSHAVKPRLHRLAFTWKKEKRGAEIVGGQKRRKKVSMRMKQRKKEGKSKVFKRELFVHGWPTTKNFKMYDYLPSASEDSDKTGYSAAHKTTSATETAS